MACSNFEGLFANAKPTADGYSMLISKFPPIDRR